MGAEPLDRIDEGILYYLQQDARNTTTTEMGEKLDVASSTIRNRIERLEERGIIDGYRPEIDYEAADLRLQMVFTCTAPDASGEILDEVLDCPGVVRACELLGDERNLHVEAVGADTDDLTRIADSLRDLDLEIVQSDVLKNRRSQPYNHFESDPTDL